MERFKPQEDDPKNNEYLNPNSLSNRARRAIAVLSAITFSFLSQSKAGEPKGESTPNISEAVIPNNEAGEAFREIAMHKISPLESPTIGKIEVKVFPKGFQKIVFVIRQIHSIDTESSEYLNLTAPQKFHDLTVTTKTQEQIQAIVDWIHKKTHTTNVILENFYPQEIPAMKEAWKDRATAEHALLEHYGRQIDDALKTGSTIPSEYTGIYVHYPTESLLLDRPWVNPIAGEPEIDPKSLHEIEELEKKYGKGVNPGSPGISEDDRKKLERLVCTRREEHVLKMVRNQKDATSIVIYGASHDFTQEVETSNTGNPEKNICLVVITPEAVQASETPQKK